MSGTKTTPAKPAAAKPAVGKVSTDPAVPTSDTTLPPNTPDTKDGVQGPVDPQAAAIEGQAQREQLSTAAPSNDGTVVPSGGVVRQIENGVETDRRTGAQASQSLAGENLPVLRANEPDPRQGVTTGDLTNPGVITGEDTETVTFKAAYHLYNRGEQAHFSVAEAARLRALGVVE